MRLRTWIFALSAVLIATPISAQEPGTVELGGFAQGTRFDEHTTLSDATALGGGGFLGR